MKNAQIIPAIILLLMLIVSAIAAPLALADKDDDKGKEGEDAKKGEVDEEKERYQRETKVEVATGKVSIESELKEGKDKDKFEAEIKIKNELEIEFKYMSKSDEAKYNMAFRVKFMELLEYNDTNANGMYDVETDEMVKKYELDNSSKVIFGAIWYNNGVTQTDGSVLHKVSAETTDGVFNVTFYISTVESGLGNGTVYPTEIKYDTTIKDFPYKCNESALALFMRVKTGASFKERGEANNRTATNEKALGMDANGSYGYFKWATNATVDGVSKEVKHDLLDPETEGAEKNQKVYLSFPRGDLIIHDPAVGVTNVVEEESSTPFVGSGMILAALGAAGIRKRRS